MSPAAARAIVVCLPWALVGWTIGCWYWDLPHRWTSSQVMFAACRAYPILAWLFGFICSGIVADAFPQVEWHWLMCLAVAFACIGHALWPL